jgi:hypothetical protein
MFVFPVGGVAGGFLTGLGGMSLLWVLIPKVNIDVTQFKWTHWAGALSTYFLVFLTVWVVLCNPPFNDFASPEIREVRVSWDGGLTWDNVTASALGGGLEAVMKNSTRMIVRAQVTDNVGVDASTVTVARGSEAPQPMSTPGNQIFEFSFTDVSKFNTFTITATDINGNSHAGYSFTLA